MKTTHCPYCGQAHPEDAETCPVTGKPLTSSFLQIGKIVGGKYELLKLLGEGGIGFVYEARNVEIRNLVALKLVHGPLAATPEVRQRFIREAIAAAEIGHENIINVFDKGVDQATGAIYIVMELLKGETLADKVKRDGMLNVPDTADIMLQVLSALKAAHEKGIVHRNMKPENVFLTKIAGRKDFVKILDFGVALIREPAEGKTYLESEAIMGTPHYLAPEQVGGTGKLDARVDVYACGAMLYEALVGRVPFDAPSFHAVIYKIINELPPGPRTVNPRLSKDLERIVLTAVKKDPAERFPTAEAFGRALEPFGTGRIEFDRYTFLPPKREQAAPEAPCPEPQPAQAAQAARKPPRKGLPILVVLLMVGLPLVSIVALIALVVLNVFYFGGGSEPEKDAVVEVNKGAGPAKDDAKESPDAPGDAAGDPACAAADAADAADVPVEEEVAAGRRLEIVTDPPGAEILVNGLAVGTSPLEYETTEDKVDLEANLEGYELFKTSYEVKSDSTHVEIKLVPVPDKKKKKKKCDPRDPKCRVGGR